MAETGWRRLRAGLDALRDLAEALCPACSWRHHIER